MAVDCDALEVLYMNVPVCLIKSRYIAVSQRNIQMLARYDWLLELRECGYARETWRDHSSIEI